LPACRLAHLEGVAAFVAGNAVSMTISNANFYHNATKPKLTYLLETNSIVICRSRKSAPAGSAIH
jgi:hypothetical protein